VTFPLSFSEQRLWFLDRLQPGTFVNNVPEALRLKGSLITDLFKQSIQEITRRHEILRTAFAELDGEPVQIVLPSLNPCIAIQDLTHLPADEREQEAFRWISDDANQPFDLEQGPLLRVMLLRLMEDEHILLINMHHIVSDGWSMGVFLQELSVLYNSSVAGQPSPLSALAIQYGDFAKWQRQRLHDSAMQESLSYWKTQLRGAPAVLALGSDRPRPATQTFKGSRESLPLPAPLKSALEQLSKDEGVTPFMTLLAGYKALLFRYTQQEDLVVGVPVSGRSTPQTQELIGPFVNTLALRTDLSGDPAFRELLQRVRRVCSEAYAHDEIPFQVLVDALKPDRSLAHAPLFQVMCAYQNTPRASMGLRGIVASPFDFETRTSMLDLKLFLCDQPEGMLATLEYSTDLFDQSTIQRLLGHFRALLESAVANPDQPISRLPLLSAEERHTLLVNWNNTQSEYPREACIHALFEQQMERTPEATAVIFEGRQLTYRELNRKANQLAHHLRKLGIKAESRVGICLDRSLDMIIGLLGILKAGGAYVPMDPEFPSERLAFMLEDSGVVAVLTSDSIQQHLSSRRVTIVCIDRLRDEIARESGETPESIVGSENLAYVIYTSGSTGRPKGVQISHRAVVNFLHSMRKRPGVSERDRMLSVTTLSFDIACLEIYMPLATGASVVVATRRTAADGTELIAKIEESRCTVMQATPSTWRLLLEAGWAGKKDMKILCGGEAMTRDLAAQLLPRCSSLWNMYGPTETTIWSSICEIRDAREPITIGRPIHNTQMYILDAQGNLVPMGARGELCIGGDGLSRGYLNQPELTAGSFIRNPFDLDSRLYRTGDLARQRQSGEIECLGRMDNQVKVRGYRIELEEIEASLREHPAVSQAAVSLQENDSGDTRLVAYVCPRAELCNITKLRTFLEGKLPGYMIPSWFVVLDQLPLNPNGKIDRRALPPPDARSYETSDVTAPMDEIETRLSDIWCLVLGLNSISMTDNFFEIGGDSMLSVRLFSEINREFKVHLPLATLFHAPTVRSLAEILRSSGVQKVRSALVPIRRRGARPPVFCIGALSGELIVFRGLALELGDQQPLYGLQPFGLGDRSPTLLQVEDIAAYYIQQIKAAGQYPPHSLMGYSFGGLVAIEMALQLGQSGEPVAAVVLIDADNLAATKAQEQLRDRIRRYRYQLREMLYGDRRHDHLQDRLREQYLRTIYRITTVLGVPPPKSASSISDMQRHASEKYRARPYSGRVYLLKAESRSEFFDAGPALGWEGILSNLVVQEVPGDHNTINLGSNVKILAGELARCLSEHPL
jgi:amino acid adenylation domain-containing protein